MSYFEKVYEIVKKIPAGKVATYGQIARLLGTPERAKIVGWAFIKIHIMVKFLSQSCEQNGEISSGFAFGGPFEQKKMLEKEGIIFDENGKINLNKYLWNPYEFQE